MAVVLDSFFLCRQEPERRWGSSRRRGFRLEPRHVVLAIAAGCLAFAWARARRRRSSADVEPEPMPQAPPLRTEPILPPRPFTRPDAATGAPKPASPPIARTVTMPAWASLAASTDVAAHWLERADQAAHMGRPWALRRIAAEMERAGRDVEAGLLNNYALLLEHSKGSRARVRAEVTRMLQAAMGQRRSVPLPRRTATLPLNDASARPLAPPGRGPLAPVVPEVEPLRTLIERSLPVVDAALPLPVERRRRAGR
jgi:hypothetical protein